MNNLLGLKFGKLTVIDRSKEKYNDGHVHWNCICDCGKSRTVSSHNLQNGNVTSCGCARKGVNLIDISGKKFGRLVALSPTNKRLGNSVIWECSCECGRICHVASSSLINGNTKSCGCLSAEIRSACMYKAQDFRKKYYIDDTDVLSIVNAKCPKNNTSGRKGVCFDASVGLFKAGITFKKHRYYLGGYKSINDAVDARIAAEKNLHGEFIEWFKATYPDQFHKIIKKDSP